MQSSINPKQHLKILHVITSIDRGGAENHLLALAQSQKKDGHEVHIAYLKGNHELKTAFSDLQISTYFLNITQLANYLSIFELKSLIKTLSPQIIHAHMPPSELICRFALIGNSKIPFIISKHNDERFAPYIKNTLLLNWVAKRASNIICISNAVKRYFSNNLSRSNQIKLNVIYYGIEISKFSDAISASDLKFDQYFTIGTISRLTKQKSLDTLVKVFSDFKKIRPQSKLIIVGSGEQEKYLKDLTSQLEISNDVIWTGRRADIPQVLKCFDVFALTSIYEGFGLVLLEAMSAGVPIIASNISAIPEVLNNGECGLLFESQNEDALLRGLVQLQDQSLRHKLTANALNRVSSIFSIPSMSKEIENIYNKNLSL
ncbi:MAG: glycosyltransferase family 4 protein [Pseudobdellovibrionaceae bacterium]